MRTLFAALVALTLAGSATAANPKLWLSLPYQKNNVDQRWWIDVHLFNFNQDTVRVVTHNFSPFTFKSLPNLQTDGTLKCVFDPNGASNTSCEVEPGDYWYQPAVALQFLSDPFVHTDLYIWGGSGPPYPPKGNCDHTQETGTLISFPMVGQGRIRLKPDMHRVNCYNYPYRGLQTDETWIDVPPLLPPPPGGGGGQEEGIVTSTDAQPKPLPAKPKLTWGRIKALYR